MVMLLYVVLAVLLYIMLADRTDQAVERQLNERRPDEHDPRLVEDFDARPEVCCLDRCWQSRFAAVSDPPVPDEQHLDRLSQQYVRQQRSREDGPV